MSTSSNDIATLPLKARNQAFERLYIDVRRQEQRIYTDEELLKLPEISSSHIHHGEWKIRKRSAERLISYLKKKDRPLTVLEIGCGNGWLAAKLAEIKNINVVALDINAVEIDQAKRVFKKQNLQFRCDEFDPAKFKIVKFDVILFAAALQYFSPVQDIVNKAKTCLAADGEVHIIDTHFYNPDEVIRAEQRTHDYYAKLDSPQMAAFYFHHSLCNLEGFNYNILSNPNSILSRLTKSDPFYWIRIKK